MNAASLFALIVPPGTGPARPAHGEPASDVAGLFALLLAGPPPVQADAAPSADPGTRPAPALAPALIADFARPPASPPTTQLPTLPGLGPLGPEQPDMAPAALTLPPTVPVPAQAGSGPGSPMAPRAPAGPDAGLPGPASPPGTERTLAAPAPHPALADPRPGLTPPPGATAAPLPPAVALALRPVAAPSGTLEMARTPAVRPEGVSIALTTDAKVPLAPSGWSLQTSASPARRGEQLAQPRASSHPSAGNQSITAPGLEMRRPLAPILAPTSGTQGPAAGQPAADEQVWLEPPVDRPEGALARSEQAATEPVRATAPGRSAPSAPMFQIGVQIARAIPARIDRLFVQLEPASLGRVEVRLEFHRDNQVSAVIAAERPDTLDALQRDARVLERSLNQAGLRLDSDGLTFSLKREQAHDHSHEERPLAPPAGDLGDRPLLTAHGHEPAPVQWFRGLRALDIRV